MPQRAYTVAEIDRMREMLVRLRGSSVAEDQLRTYMLAGITPDELDAALEVWNLEREAQRQAWRDAHPPIRLTRSWLLSG
jgi:hypothetical protein